MLKLFRKYYLPGIISLVGLPIVMFYILGLIYAKKQFTVEIVMPHENDEFFQYSRSILEKRNPVFFKLKAKLDNQNIIDSAFTRISKIDVDKDSLNCYFFTNLYQQNYEVIIELLDQCLIHDLDTYGLINDTLIILHIPYHAPPPDPNAQHFEFDENFVDRFCGTGALRKAEYEKAKAREIWLTPIINFIEFSKLPVLPLALLVFGMLFFYFILPYIQKRISSK